MQHSQNVVVLQIFLKYDDDKCVKQIAAIRRALKRKFWPTMHDRRHMAFVFLTTETPRILVDRLRAVLEVDEISNYWAFVPTANIVGKFGSLDSLATRVGMAYSQVRKIAKPKDVVQVETRVRKSFGHHASGQMAIKGGGDRKPPKKPYRQDRE